MRKNISQGPELRFKFNGEWKELRLKDLLVAKSSNISINDLEDNCGDFPLYGASGFIKNIDFYQMDSDYISIVKDGSGVGKLSYYESKSSIVGTSQYLLPKEGFDINFLYHALQTKNLEKYITGSSIPHIYFRDYSIEKLKVPIKEEQEKIGIFLKSFDKKIELLEKTLNLYEKQTKFFINQTLLNIEEYEEVKLKDLVKAQTSNLSINKLDENEGTYPLYGAEGIIKYINFFEMNEKYITIIKDGNGVGRLNLCQENSSYLGTLQCLIPNENMDINFLYYYLTTLNFEKYIVGSTIPHIYFKDYSKERLKIPSSEHQLFIGNYLSSLEKRNNLIKNKINNILLFKKGLLQKMFI